MSGGTRIAQAYSQKARLWRRLSYSTASILGPDNVLTRHTVNNKWRNPTEGLIVKTETFSDAAASKLVRTVIPEYAAGNLGPYPEKVGHSMVRYSNLKRRSRFHPVSRTSSHAGWGYASTIRSMHSMLLLVRSRSLSRTLWGLAVARPSTIRANLGKWLLGQVKSAKCFAPTACAGKEMLRVDYDAATALPPQNLRVWSLKAS